MAKSVEFRFYARMQELLRGIAQGKAGMGELQQESRQFGMSADEVRAKMALLSKEIGGLKDVTAIRQKQDELKRLGAQLDDINGKQAKADGGMSVGKGAFLGSLAGGLGASALSALPGLIMGVGSAMVSGNAEMEKYEIQFATLMGSADAAKARLKDLAKFGAETPFELPEIAAAEKVLLGFGLTGQKVIDLTGKNAEGFRTLVGDIAAGTGASFEEIALNMGKLSSGATGEAISRFQEMGIATREQLKEMGVQFSKSGELLSPLPVAMQAITKLTEEKFGGGMKSLSNSAEGLASTLQDTFGEIARNVGAPVFEAAKGGLLYVLDVLKRPEVKAVIDALKNGFEDIKEKLDDPKIQKALDVIIEAMSWLAETGIEVLVDSVEMFIDYQTSILDAADALGILNLSTNSNARAQLRANEALTKGKTDQLEYAKNTEKLVGEYEKLASKTQLTRDEEARRQQVLAELQRDYPDLITNTDTFGASLDGVRAVGEQTRTQIAGLTEDIRGLSESSKSAQLIILQGQIQEVKEGLVDLGWSWRAVNEGTEDLRAAKSLGELDAALNKYNDTTTGAVNRARAAGNEDLVKSATKALELGMELYEVRKQMLALAGKVGEDAAGGGGTGAPPPPASTDDEKKRKEAFDKEMAELARKQALDEAEAKRVHATEQTLFDIWVGYQERRIAAAQKYGQDRADLENELAVARKTREGQSEDESRALAKWAADQKAKAAERERAEEEKKTKKFNEELDKRSEAVSKSVKDAEEREKERTKLEQEESRMRTEAGMQALENLQAAAGEGNAVFKAAAIARTGISTYEGATSAYAALAGIPLVGPALGIAAAAAAIAAGLANVGKIAGTKLADGGILDRPTFVAGEAGQEVVAPLRALPGILASSLRLALRPETRRTKIREKSGTKISVGISSRVVGRGSRASQVSSTVGTF